VAAFLRANVPAPDSGKRPTLFSSKIEQGRGRG
jgi:hypothetical protein